MTPDERAQPAAASRAPAARVENSADRALDALVAAAAVMITAQERPSSAARMSLLVCARRSGLLATPPQRDVLAELDAVLLRCRADLAEQRRMLICTARMLVGGPWAPLLLAAAEQIGTASRPLDPAGRAALRAVASALALRGPPAR